MDLSIIVPVYKVEPYLRRCVKSLMAQTCENYEVLLVDDGSPDSCPKICDELAACTDNIRVIHKANGGLSSARNAGLFAARGDYIGFVDSDDVAAPDMFAIMLTYPGQQHLMQTLSCAIISVFYEQAGGG